MTGPRAIRGQRFDRLDALRGLAIVCGASGLLVPVGRHQIIELLQLVLGRARAAAPDTPPAVATIAPAGSSTREATP